MAHLPPFGVSATHTHTHPHVHVHSRVYESLFKKLTCAGCELNVDVNVVDDGACCAFEGTLSRKYGVEIMDVGNDVLCFILIGGTGIFNPTVSLQCVRAAMKETIPADPVNQKLVHAAAAKQKKMVKYVRPSNTDVNDDNATFGTISMFEWGLLRFVASTAATIASSPAFALSAASQVLPVTTAATDANVTALSWIGTPAGCSGLLQSTLLDLASGILFSAFLPHANGFPAKFVSPFPHPRALA